MKKLISVILVFAMSFALVACSSTKYEDTNGEDIFTLQTITDEEILNLSTGASGLTHSETDLGSMLMSSEYSSKNFNGVERIFLTNFIAKSDLNIYIGHMDVSAGNFKLVLANDGKIIHEFALDTFNELFLFEDLKGETSVFVAGESAEFSFYIDIY